MNVVEQIGYAPFEPEEHLPGVLALCETEGWDDLAAEPDRLKEALRAPGVTTVVATSESEVAGFVQMQGDGVFQAHLSLISVDSRFRRRGIGRRLIEEAFRRCGGERVDLISTGSAEPFYESFAPRARSGYRIFPEQS